METKFNVVQKVWIWRGKFENGKTFEGLRIEFLSIIFHFKNFSVGQIEKLSTK